MSPLRPESLSDPSFPPSAHLFCFLFLGGRARRKSRGTYAGLVKSPGLLLVNGTRGRTCRSRGVSLHLRFPYEYAVSPRNRRDGRAENWREHVKRNKWAVVDTSVHGDSRTDVSANTFFVLDITKKNSQPEIPQPEFLLSDTFSDIPIRLRRLPPTTSSCIQHNNLSLSFSLSHP